MVAPSSKVLATPPCLLDRGTDEAVTMVSEWFDNHSAGHGVEHTTLRVRRAPAWEMWMRSGRSCVAASGRRGKYAHVAHELQDVLQAAIGGSSLDAISASALSLRSGLSPEEIYGLAHADRRVPSW